MYIFLFLLLALRRSGCKSRSGFWLGLQRICSHKGEWLSRWEKHSNIECLFLHCNLMQCDLVSDLDLFAVTKVSLLQWREKSRNIPCVFFLNVPHYDPSHVFMVYMCFNMKGSSVKFKSVRKAIYVALFLLRYLSQTKQKFVRISFNWVHDKALINMKRSAPKVQPSALEAMMKADASEKHGRG